MPQGEKGEKHDGWCARVRTPLPLLVSVRVHTPITIPFFEGSFQAQLCGGYHTRPCVRVISRCRLDAGVMRAVGRYELPSTSHPCRLSVRRIGFAPPRSTVRGHALFRWCWFVVLRVFATQRSASGFAQPVQGQLRLRQRCQGGQVT